MIDKFVRIKNPGGIIGDHQISGMLTVGVNLPLLGTKGFTTVQPSLLGGSESSYSFGNPKVSSFIQVGVNSNLSYARCKTKEFCPDMMSDIFKVLDPKLFGFGQVLTSRLWALINNIGIIFTDELGLIKGSAISSMVELKGVDHSPIIHTCFQALGKRIVKDKEQLVSVRARGQISPALFLASGYQVVENSTTLPVLGLKGNIFEEIIPTATQIAENNGGILQLMRLSIQSRSVSDGIKDPTRVASRPLLESSGLKQLTFG
jgi:hypothetical protein